MATSIENQLKYANLQIAGEIPLHQKTLYPEMQAILILGRGF